MKILIGNLLESNAQTLINTVNCVGIMGKGIALEFKNKFPEMFAEYAARCERKEVKPGIPYLYRDLFPPQIINFPTKDHWKSASRLDDIDKGLQHLLKYYGDWGVTSLAIPPLGCGNGQLEWRTVGPLIYSYVRQMDIPVEIYAPYGTPPQQLTVDFLSQRNSKFSRYRGDKIINSSPRPAWIALVEILHRLERQPYHWPVGRTIFQKIAYIATRQGLPTGFVYQKESFGPFSKDLKSAQALLINDNLICEERSQKMFMVKVGPNYERVRDDFKLSFRKWEDIIERTTDLFMRMNTEQAEIVATVLYVADTLKQLKKELPREIEIFDSVMQWKQKRRPPLDRVIVASAVRNLGMLRWLQAKPDGRLPISEDA